MNHLSYIIVAAVSFMSAAANASVTSLSVTNSLSSSTNKIEVPISVFVIPTNAADGRDPFFPESMRFASGSTNTPAAVTLQVTFTLQGISGAAGNKLAIINGRTLAEGEETDLVVNGTRIRLRCVAIKNDSVTVEAGGNRQELRLRNL